MYKIQENPSFKRILLHVHIQENPSLKKILLRVQIQENLSLKRSLQIQENPSFRRILLHVQLQENSSLKRILLHVQIQENPSLKRILLHVQIQENPLKIEQQWSQKGVECRGLDEGFVFMETDKKKKVLEEVVLSKRRVACHLGGVYLGFCCM